MNEIVRITNETPTYVSLNLSACSMEEKKAFFNAKSNPTEKLSEYINMKFTFVHVSMELTDIVEKDADGNPTGEVHTTVRTVFITPDGKGVMSTSMGIVRSLYDLFGFFGTPDTWTEPVTVVVRQVDIGKNRTYRLEIC